MPKLPLISGMDLVKVLTKIDYEVDHQTGSHMILRHREAPHRRLTVPRHREMAKGTLLAILKQAGLTKEQFSSLLRR